MVSCSETTNDGGAGANDSATIVDIPDADLRFAIASKLEIQDDTSITVDDMLKLTSLGFRPGGIADLTGLEYATNLERLVLESNEIVDVSPLKALKNLENLVLENNAIVDVSPLKELKNLKYLDLSENPLSWESVEIHIPAIKADKIFW